MDWVRDTIIMFPLWLVKHILDTLLLNPLLILRHITNLKVKACLLFLYKSAFTAQTLTIE